MAVVVKTVLGSHFGVAVPPILEPILVVGLVCSLGVTGILTHAWPNRFLPSFRFVKSFPLELDTVKFFDTDSR